jgi:hypothetical protein
MINVEFTENEATVLMNLIDIAVKSAGLPAAEAALHFSKKIQEAAKAAGLDSEPTTDTKE